MFNRKKYKKYALVQLKKRWKIPVIASIIYILACVIFNIPEFYNEINGFSNFETETAEIISNLCLLLELCILYITLYAQVNLHLKMSRSPQKVTFNDYLEGFSYFSRAVVCGLWETLFTFLWSLLFIIPGIIKHYSYCMTKYIALEYPQVSVFKAIKISMEITRGHKMEIFVMELSFIGWFILSAITMGIGLCWVMPYYLMTYTNAYHALLTEAVESKRLKPEDFQD